MSVNGVNGDAGTTADQLSSKRGGHRRHRIQGIVSAAILLLSVLAFGRPAAAEVSPNGETTWGVYGIDQDTETDRIQNQVFAIEQIGNRVYVGGKFLEARPNSNGPATAQPYLAAFDADTGDFISSFRPSIESAVYALEASPDGSRLFVGGEFRSIDGDPEAAGIAALDPITGAVDTSWRARTRNSSGARGVVYNFTVSGSELYAVGRFDLVGGMSRPLHSTEKLARLSLADGTADTSIAADIAGGSVWGVAVAPDGSKIYLAGYHDAVDGDSAGADYSVLNASDGSLIPEFSDHPGNSVNISRWYGQDVVAVGDYVFWAGSEHVVRVFRASDGALVRQHSTDRGGDYQDLEVVGDRVYGACHCYTNHFADFDYWPTRGQPIPPDVLVTPIRYVAAYSADTGEYLPSFSLDMSAARSGIWAIHGDPQGCLWVGGDVSRITTLAGNDRAAGGFAKFCEGDGTDESPPTTPTNLTQTRSENHKVVIRWDASTDNIDVDHYEISRDGAVIGTKPAGAAAQFWYTDSNLDQATTYNYEVVAIDAAGNRSQPASLAAVTQGVGPDNEAPTVPTNLTQTRSENHKVVIRWDASTDNIDVDHYEISRDGAVIGTKPAGAAAQFWYTDSNLDQATTYNYEVVAVDAAGNRSQPGALEASTLGAPGGDGIPAPTDLISTLQTRERIVLNWQASPGAASYAVQRFDGVEFVDLGISTSRWHTDLGLPAGTSFTYRVLAIDAAGDRSEPSNELTASTNP